ncbi:hypothetical protein IMSHALPRED_010289 [Imshaugia aleurites]|uniref:Uncharacterized protein n=1 Tax=Imshaugia aleurites TaxID=172621 RepID=A0A8H3IPK0_9LECA|nr:hypothetical protein IMSHALPRED_010289 [Imshaugia aleurites]
MKTRPSSTATLGQSPLLKPIEPALLPEYNVVHNHCSRITEHLDPADPFIMQSYQYSPLDLGPAIGFRAPTTKYRVRVPPRKVTDLEKLPPLTSEVAAEVTRNFKVRERAGILAEIRAAREKESEVQRRASRVAQMRVPSYEAQISVVFCAKDLEAALLSEPPPTPLTRRERKHLRTQPKQYLGPTAHHVGDALEQRHVRWALEPAPQGGQDSTALAKKGHHGKQTVLRNGSKRF